MPIATVAKHTARGTLIVNTLYSVFTNNVPLAVRFATVAIGMRKAESPEYCRFDSHLH